jgi:PTH1 family peptidyl-tRNA hydrolase
LGKASVEQREQIDDAINHTLKFMTDIVQGTWDQAMNALHQR